MKTLLRTNNGLFPALPSLIEDFFNRDLLDSSNLNWRETGATMPSVNIIEGNEDFRIEVAAPGMKRDNFQIELDNNVLTIASHMEAKKEENDKQFTRREFNYQSFQRSFALPENKVDGDKITAKYIDGVLYVTVPKKEEAKVKPARQISIS